MLGLPRNIETRFTLSMKAGFTPIAIAKEMGGGFHLPSAVKVRGIKVNKDTVLPMNKLRGKDGAQRINTGCIDRPLTTLFFTFIMERELVREIGK